MRIYAKFTGPVMGLLLCLFTPAAWSQTAPKILALTPSGVLTWTNTSLERKVTVQTALVPTGGWTNWGNALTSTTPTMSVTVPLTNQTGVFRIVDSGSCCSNLGGTNQATAVNLGSGCGDSGTITFTQTGCGNAWFKVTVTECVLNSFSPAPLKIRVTLTPPAGVDYDLATYSPVTQTTSSQGGATPEDIQLTIPDNANFPSDPDQSFVLSVNVYRFSGVGCAPWTLAIRLGN